MNMNIPFSPRPNVLNSPMWMSKQKGSMKECRLIIRSFTSPIHQTAGWRERDSFSLLRKLLLSVQLISGQFFKEQTVPCRRSICCEVRFLSELGNPGFLPLESDRERALQDEFAKPDFLMPLAPLSTMVDQRDLFLCLLYHTEIGFRLCFIVSGIQTRTYSRLKKAWISIEMKFKIVFQTYSIWYM